MNEPWRAQPGSIIALVVNLSNEAVGIILAIAGGAHVQIAACECLPRVFQLFYTVKDCYLFFWSFVLGGFPIGLVLLKHSHYGM